MAVCRSSLENTGEIYLIPILNKNSPRAPTESELDMLSVPESLKYVVHSSKKKIDLKKKIFTQAAQTAMEQFLV
jgi:hypothetical protein